MEKNNETFKAIDKGTMNLDVKIEEPLKLELKDFIECVKTGRKPIVHGQVASRAVMIAEKTLESARLKGSVKINEDK
jgi:predicted dehydrogenase